MAVNGRNKGAGAEREAATVLMQMAAECGHPLNVERNLEQVRHGGADLNGIPGMEVEVKRTERLNFNAWWKQVTHAANKSGKWPVVMYRQNRQPWRFITYVYAVVYDKDQKGVVVPVKVQMEKDEFKTWFTAWLKANCDD